MKRYLIDMDGVIANFDKALLDKFQKTYPNKPFISLENRTSFYVKDDYPKEDQPLIEEIYTTQGFFLNMEPIEGSIKALYEIQKANEIFLCTSQLTKNPHCVPEKYEWIKKYLGKDWINKIVITKDKTIIQGDYLIDDKPKITGIQTPTWEHILYSQPYNVHIQDKQRLTWKNWREFLC